MESGAYKPRLVRSMSAASAAVVLSGWVAFLSVRSAILQSPHHLHWILPLDHLLPFWPALIVNVGFYLWMLWLCIVFSLRLRGKERVLVAGWVPGILLGPVQGVVSPSIAVAIQHVKAIGILIAFVAALLMLVEGFSRPNAQSDQPVPE